MTVLQRVDWPAVFRRLLDDADEELLERAMFYAGLRSAIPAPVAVFACLVCGTAGRTIDRALPVLDVDTAMRIRFWLQDQAHVALGAAGQMGAPRPAVAPADPGVLLLDPDLEALPLLDLAADVARLGGLAAEVGSLPPGIAGRYSPSARRITLDLAQGADERSWAHELGHVLDPLLGRRQAPDVDERFADELGALLLAERPTTVLAAEPLIAECRTRTDRDLAQVSPNGSPATVTGSDNLPEPGAVSLAAFFWLPLGVRPAVRR